MNARLREEHYHLETHRIPQGSLPAPKTIQACNTKSINSLTLGKLRYGSLSVPGGNPKADKYFEAIPKAGSVPWSALHPHRATTTLENTIPYRLAGETSILYWHSHIDLHRSKTLLHLTYLFFSLSLFKRAQNYPETITIYINKVIALKQC